MSLNNAGSKVISSVKTNKKNIIIIVDQKRIIVSNDTYTELRLYKGKRLLDDTFKELKRQERLENDIKYARSICIKTLRSEQDVRNRLLRREVSKKDVDYIISELRKSNLINDEKYVSALVEHLNHKLYGKLRIYQELKRRNVKTDIEISSDVERSKLLELYPKVYEKYLRKNDKSQAKIKTVKYLITRGYLIEDIQSIEGENL